MKHESKHDMNLEYFGPKRFAHRGMLQGGPENTLGAFEGALRAGVEGVEIDVRRARDGEVVVVHDESLSRMTLGHPAGQCHSRIEDLSWEELSAIELPVVELPYAGDLSGEMTQGGRMARLMRLKDFLRWLEGCAPLMAEIEIKAEGMAKPLVELIAASPAVDRCILFSGVPAYNAELQAFCSTFGKPKGLKLGANLRVIDEETKAQIAAMDLYEAGLNAATFTQQDVLYLQERGILPFSNLGDHPALWEKICTSGIYAFKTNEVTAFTQWWHSWRAAER